MAVTPQDRLQQEALEQELEQVSEAEITRIAWMVLLSAFAVFCLLAVSIPWGTYRFVRTATAAQMASVEPIRGTSGTVLMQIGRLSTQPVSAPMDAPEGARITTDEASKAFIQFFEGSTLRLGPNTEVILRRMRAPRWRWSRAPNTLEIQVLRGRVTIGVAEPYFGVPLQCEVRSPHMQARLSEGSYRIDVAPQETQVVAYQKGYKGVGRAEIQAAGETVVLGPRQRTRVPAGGPPSPPFSITENLLADSTFSRPLGEAWTVFHDQGGDGDDGVDGQASIVEVEGRRAVQFLRRGSRDNSADVGVSQQLNVELPDQATSLTLQAELKVLEQELAGGGFQSTEYPVIFRLKYKDAGGNDHVWYHGFYFKPGNAMQNGEQVPRGRWYIYDSGNLLDPETGLNPPPVKLISLDVLASGHDYWSMVSVVWLLVE